MKSGICADFLISATSSGQGATPVLLPVMIAPSDWKNKKFQKNTSFPEIIYLDFNSL